MTDVKLSQVPNVDVGSAGGTVSVKFDVGNRDEDPHGELEIGTGGVNWIPKGPYGKRSKSQLKHLSWKQLVDLIKDKGRSP